MTFIPFETRSFPPPHMPTSPLHPPTTGFMYASQASLQWAALTVGVSATSASPRNRPLAELVWRSAMMEACLEAVGPRWHKTASYDRLDGSEKQAVSYFLGMAQAQLSAHLLLGVPSLVHLDAYLKAVGRPTGKSRPDFLGYDPVTRNTLALEAKGRSNRYSAKILQDAKNQAKNLPTVATLAAQYEVASVAWFDVGGSWNAILVDPPRQRNQPSIDPNEILAAHYLPVVQAAQESGGVESDSDGRARFRVEAVDLGISLPSVVLEALGRPGIGSKVPWPSRLLAAAGRDISAFLAETSSDTIGRDRSDPSTPDPSPDTHIGGDLVAVHLGASWF